MADVHRKIELQEQDDLRYLINNACRRANERIDDALPPIEGEDALRTRVEELVHEYISTTYLTASENITINGLPPSQALLSSLLSTTSSKINTSNTTEEYEPLESKLLTRAQELMSREADLLEEIADLKREVPAQAADKWRVALRTDLERDEEALRNHSGTDDGRKLKLAIERLERQDEVERTWERGVEGLGRLKREMPGTTARMERAKRGAEYALEERETRGER